MDLVSHLLQVKPSTSNDQLNGCLHLSASVCTSRTNCKFLNCAYCDSGPPDVLQEAFTRVKSEKFRPENIQYYDLLLEAMRSVSAHDIKLFYETVIKLQVCNSRYGHAQAGGKTTEICPHQRGCHFTLLLLCSLEGVDYVKLILGSADRLQYLQFWTDASRFTTPSGKPIYTKRVQHSS